MLKTWLRAFVTSGALVKGGGEGEGKDDNGEDDESGDHHNENNNNDDDDDDDSDDGNDDKIGKPCNERGHIIDVKQTKRTCKHNDINNDAGGDGDSGGGDSTLCKDWGHVTDALKSAYRHQTHTQI
jgi:hypothetical protein